MIEVLFRLGLAATLLAAAGLKLVRPSESRAAMATHGFVAPTSQWLAWAAVLVAELGLAVGVALGSTSAAYLAGAMMLVFAATLGSAVIQGKSGAPCACFGAGSTVGWVAIARNLLLAVGFFALPSLADFSLSTDQWLAVGLAVALLAVVALAVAVLALAREVGMLRLRLGPSAALEVSHEGPEVGGQTALVEDFELGPRTELGLAVFTSVGCHVCRALGPAVDSLANEPALSVRRFEEAADAKVWQTLAIPGAPYAIAIGTDGTVLAKGTFNNLAQLEGIVATAERRREERSRIEALGV